MTIAHDVTLRATSSLDFASTPSRVSAGEMAKKKWRDKLGSDDS
jgi:hypothetical protein